MKLHRCLFAFIPLIVAGCADEPVPVATTTTTTTEVTTTGPAPVVGPTREVLVTQAPPPVRVETQTVAPGPNYTYQKGYWRWTGAGYTWAPGHWVVRPRTTAVWVEGHWVQRGNGWIWVGGHWR
jgi:hypothetical protein